MICRMVSGSYSQERGMSLLPANLSPAILTLCSSRFYYTFQKNFTGSASILDYPKSTKWKKENVLSGLSTNESLCFIVQQELLLEI